MHASGRVLLQYKALDIVLLSGLFGNRDGSDRSAHLRNLIRLFFYRISSEMGVNT